MKRLFDEQFVFPGDRKRYRVILTTDLHQDERGMLLDASPRVARCGLNRFERSLVEPGDTLFEVSDQNKWLWFSLPCDFYIGALFNKNGEYKEGKQYLNYCPAPLHLEDIEIPREGDEWQRGRSQGITHRDQYQQVAGILSYLCHALPPEHIKKIDSLLYEPAEELRIMEQNEARRTALLRRKKADTQP